MFVEDCNEAQIFLLCGMEGFAARRRLHSSRPRFPSDNPFMSFSPLVTNPGRLRILLSLATTQSQEFVQLRSSTQMTDGNLSAHAKRLCAAGLIEMDKSFRGGKPLTQFRLTSSGRAALEAHASAVLCAVNSRPSPVPIESSQPDNSDSNDWID